MDQFSHDLTLALEETSLMARACGVGAWGSRRRTRSTGNLPCAPQPTEDSSSSPTDTVNIFHNHNSTSHTNNNIDGLDMHNAALPASDSDEKAQGELPLRLPHKNCNMAMRLGTLESDSLNETNFSPARFYKPSSRRKRKIKRMSMEFELSNNTPTATSPQGYTESPIQPAILSAGSKLSISIANHMNTTTVNANSCANASTGTIRKRLLKLDSGYRSNIFFCGKRKRSNRDRYHDHEHGVTTTKIHTTSMSRHVNFEEHRMRPRSFSSTSKPHSERLLPLNKGLLSKIERISQAQKTDDDDRVNKSVTIDSASTTAANTVATATVVGNETPNTRVTLSGNSSRCLEFIMPVHDVDLLLGSDKNKQQERQQLKQLSQKFQDAEESLKKTGILNNFNTSPPKIIRLRRPRHQLNNIAESFLHKKLQSMDCNELNDFLSSSSISSDSDDDHRPNDTDREGDDELTDWPGNEFGTSFKYDPKRKLTKKSTLPQIRSDDTIGEDDTLMSGTESTFATPTMKTEPIILDTFTDLYRSLPSQHICITDVNHGLVTPNSDNIGDTSFDMDNNVYNSIPPFKQIESEMSGETSNPFSTSSPLQTTEIREIRAGCRRIKGERPGFSIKLSVNERLARFLQDPRQMQIRLPDIEIYERDSLLNLATLYSLTMTLDKNCAILTKTSNTTQSVNIDQRSFQIQNLFLSDFKRRCYDDGNDAFMPHK